MRFEFDDHVSIEHEIPLDWKLSKNQKITFSNGRTIFNKDKSRVEKIAQDIGYLSMSKGIHWRKDKIWVVIEVHKPNHRGDCANFIDSLADAIKKGIQIDDAWFSFIVDYVIDEQAKIVIKVIQEA